MPSITRLAVTIVILFDLALASSANGFSVALSTKNTGISGPVGLRNTLLKYGRSVWPGLEAAAEDPSILVDEYMKILSSTELADLHKQTGTASTRPDNGDWTAPFTVGNTVLDLVLDTGSSDFWVYSTLLPKSDQKGHALYNSSSGTLLKGYSWNITYGDGSYASGIVYRDSVRIGGATATSQAVEAASVVPSRNTFGRKADGLAGLAFQKLNTIKPHKQPPLWADLHDIFAVDFRPNGGTIEFGATNASKYEGTIAYTGLGSDDGRWYFNFGNFSFDRTTYNPMTYHHQRPGGTLDTGTGYLVVSSIAADKYYTNIKGAKKVQYTWVFPCDSAIYDFGIEIEGRYFYADKAYLKQPFSSTPYICFGGLQGAAGEYSKYEEGDIIGTPFIESNYIVYDGLNKRIGFAAKSIP